MKKQNKKSEIEWNELAKFGARVLEVMEADKDWGADTMDRLHSEAKARGLADADAEGFFKVARFPLSQETPMPIYDEDEPDVFTKRVLTEGAAIR